jgi:LytS/YehU family sensor histidine kinase
MFDKLSYSTVKEFVNLIVKRLLVFYMLVLLIGFLLFVITGIAISLFNHTDPMEFIKNIPRYEMRGFIIGSGIGLLTGSVIFFVSQLFAAINRLQKLNEEKLVYQYQTLKNQVNPHFLFNSLNTLSSLVYTDPELADEFIRKLASSYRYILDNNQNNLVPVSDELKFVQAYFYLHQLRGAEKFQLKIKDLNADGWHILPVSVQVLVENALKHNAATAESPLLISIQFENPGYISVSNNKQPMPQGRNLPQTGLSNLGERVRQICGRDLIVQETFDDFKVKIPLIQKNENTDY